MPEFSGHFDIKLPLTQVEFSAGIMFFIVLWRQTGFIVTNFNQFEVTITISNYFVL